MHRRHISLLRSLVADGTSSSVVPMHTILEVYRVSDLSLECVLPSADDEVNAACFHPIEVCHPCMTRHQHDCNLDTGHSADMQSCHEDGAQSTCSSLLLDQ